MGKKARNRSVKNSNGGSCGHAGSAVPALKKALNKTMDKGPDFSSCKACKSGESVITNGDVNQKELFVCLRCCYVGCRNHVGIHSRAPRSDMHCHYLSTISAIAHCTACDFKALDEDENHNIRTAIAFLLQHMKKINVNLSCVSQNDSEDWRAKAMKKVQNDDIHTVKGDTNQLSNELSVDNGQICRSPTGLINLGSTCYMNSSLQSLAACENVRVCVDNFFKENISISLQSEEADEASIIGFGHQSEALPERLAEVLRRVRPFESEWKNGPSDSKKVARSKIVGLKAEFTQRYPQFSNDWTEQDAHEFLRHFIDLVSENTKRRTLEVCKEKDETFIKRSCTAIERIFRSSILNVKHCDHCDHYSANLEHALDLCVALDKDVLSFGATSMAGAGVEVKRSNASSMSKHKMKKMRKEHKKKHRKNRNTSGRTVSESQSTVPDDNGDCSSSSEDDPNDEDVDHTDNFEKSTSKADKPKETSYLSSSEDENNYDIFAIGTPNYDSVVLDTTVEENFDQTAWNDNFIRNWASRNNPEADDPVHSDVGVGSTLSRLSSGFLTGMSPEYAEVSKTDSDMELINKFMLEDLEALENEDNMVPLFDDLEIHGPCSEPVVAENPSTYLDSLDCNPLSMTRCSSRASFWSQEACDQSSTRAELDNSQRDLSSDDHENYHSPNEFSIDDCAVGASLDPTENGESEEKDTQSAEDEETNEKGMDPEAAKLAAETLSNAQTSSGLESLLEKYFERTVLEDFKCPSCKKCGGTSSRQVFIEPPPVLMITVKRFRGCIGQTQKIAANVDFPIVLDVSKFTSRLSPYVNKNLSKQYRLRAVIQHHGTARSGHYVAYVCVSSRTRTTSPNINPMTIHRELSVEELNNLCHSHLDHENPSACTVNGESLHSDENEDENWFLVSDMAVEQTSLRKVLNAQAYILFYESV